MATTNVATTGTKKKLRERSRAGSRVAVLFATVACSALLLSGCAGLATNSNGSVTPQAALEITPSNITFSNVAVGQKVTQTATLTNAGKDPMTITQVSLSSAEFAVSGITTPLTIGPGQSAKFQVQFTGSTSGTVSGTLKAKTLRSGYSSTLNLSASAKKAVPQLALSATALNFGNVLVNGSSTQAVALTNSGQSDVQITRVGVTGGAFTASGVVVPATIAAGQSLVLQAKFSPTAGGATTGTITVKSDAQNAASTVALSGTGVAASYTMSLSPSSLNFGNVNAGSTGTQSVQISNTGNTGLTVTQVTASGTGISVSGVTTPIAIAPSASVTIAVKYSPTTSGTTTGSLKVVNDAGVNAVAAVTGTSLQAGLSVTPGSVSFSSVVTGSTNSQTVQIKNSGNANLTISQATVAGTGFSLNGVALPVTLAAGQSGNFNVQYAPQTSGNTSGSVSIVSNAPNSPTTVALSATGVTASYTISVNPSSLSFGSVSSGSATAQGFTIKNTGNSNVAISGLTLQGSGYSIASGAGGVTLSPNQSSSVSVQFAPTAAGSANGSVAIVSNATGSTPSVSLSGTGAAASVNHSIGLNWNASTSSVSGYNVYRSSVSGSSYSRMNGSLVGGVNYADSSAQSGLTYYYVATSVDASGNESVYSNEVSAIVP